ncbi:hypothetical protein ACU8KH_03524 [Lachancea thermotolerans]
MLRLSHLLRRCFRRLLVLAPDSAYLISQWLVVLAMFHVFTTVCGSPTAISTGTKFRPRCAKHTSTTRSVLSRRFFHKVWLGDGSYGLSDELPKINSSCSCAGTGACETEPETSPQGEKISSYKNGRSGRAVDGGGYHF